MEIITLYDKIPRPEGFRDCGVLHSVEKNEANGALKQAKRLLKIIDSVRKKLIKEIA